MRRSRPAGWAQGLIVGTLVLTLSAVLPALLWKNASKLCLEENMRVTQNGINARAGSGPQLLAFVGIHTGNRPERRQALRFTWFPSTEQELDK